MRVLWGVFILLFLVGCGGASQGEPENIPAKITYRLTGTYPTLTVTYTTASSWDQRVVTLPWEYSYTISKNHKAYVSATDVALHGGTGSLELFYEADGSRTPACKKYFSQILIQAYCETNITY